MTTDRPHYLLVPSPIYAEKRSRLTGELLRLVELTEDRIAEDPDDGDQRFPSDDGGSIDYGAADLLIKFHRDERSDHPDEVALDDLLPSPGSGISRWPTDVD